MTEQPTPVYVRRVRVKWSPSRREGASHLLSMDQLIPKKIPPQLTVWWEIYPSARGRYIGEINYVWSKP